MERKYQIFISSTYDDLKEERQKVQEAILSMHQFPIGMEMFSAADEEQWEIIKQAISCSDYYVLILAQRYGTTIKAGVDIGISYTEKEYRFAKSIGIPILAFIIDDSVPVLPCNIDKNKKQLNRFKSEVTKGRLVEWWRNGDDLKNKVTVALYKQIMRNNRPGWSRIDDKKLALKYLSQTNEILGVPKDKTSYIPMYFQEDQDTYRFLSNSKEIIFCARTGKGFINGHYNILKQFINNGGVFRFITTGNINLLFDDQGEHEFNNTASIQFLRNLYRINPSSVTCGIVNSPLNLTLLYVKTVDDIEFIEIKFVRQTKNQMKHPLLRLNKESTFFSIFYDEIINLYKISDKVDFRSADYENSN